MTYRGKRQGGWLWLAVFVASVVGLTGGIWRLGQDLPVIAATQPSPATSSSPPTTAPAPSTRPTSSPRTPARTAEQSSGWSTQKASPDVRASGEPRPPKRLRIPRLDLAMPIIATTLDSAGLMALPERPSEIGWYSYGPRPGGREGSAVLAGHVDSKEYGVGPLADLRRLSNGDKIIIEGGADRLIFRVDSVKQIRKRAVPLADVFDRNGPPLLRIVTCDGAYLPARGGYQDNLIVTATRQ